LLTVRGNEMSLKSAINHQLQPANKLAIWAAMVTIYIVWGSTYLAIRFAVATIPPFYMASLRFLLAGGILFLFRRLAGDPLPTLKEWRSAGIIGLFLLLGGNGSLVWAEQRIPSSLAALLVGTVPLWMVIIDALKPGGKWPRWQIMAGVVIGFGGIALLFWPGQNVGGSKIDLIGALVVLIGSIAWASGSLYTRTATLPLSPLLGTSMEMLVGGVSLFLVGSLSGEATQINLQLISTKSLLGMGYLIVFGSLVGFATYTWVLRAAPTSLVSTYAYVNPLVAIMLGYFFANETLGIRTIVAAVIILGSVLLTTRAPKTVPTSPSLVSFSSGDD
jgi:drug/metabolite transporter (DMT)-like permease